MMMKLLKNIPFFLLFIVVFFCLHGTVENIGFISFKEVFLVGISVAVVILIMFLLFFLLTRQVLYASLITFFISVWYFFFGAILDFIKSIQPLSFLQHYSVLVPFLIVLTFLWIFFLRKKRHLWQNLTLYLNALLLIYVVIDVVNLCASKLANAKKKHPINFDYNLVHDKPNVYFLLFDGYPGAKTLMDSFNFDNKGLHDFLVEKKFVSLPIKSNYDYTLYSMSSMFNMQYVNDDFKVNEETQRDGQMRQQEIKEGAVFDVFEKMDYKILNYSVFDIKNLPGLSDENSFLLGHSILLTNKILINKARKDLIYIFTDKQIKYFPFLKNQSVFIDRNNNLKAQKLTELAASQKTDKPIFCYTHFLLPHPPYFFDSSGTETDYKKMTDMSTLMNKKNFLSYLKYTNSVIKSTITTIREKDPHAVVIFLSDHGVRSIRKPYLQPANFNNVCYLYLPAKNYLPLSDHFTNVNIFPYLFNTAFNQKISFLKDTSFTNIPAPLK